MPHKTCDSWQGDMWREDLKENGGIINEWINEQMNHIKKTDL